METPSRRSQRHRVQPKPSTGTPLRAAWWSTVALSTASALFAAVTWAVPATHQQAERAVAYRQVLSFNYEARVRPVSIYPGASVHPADLAPCQPGKAAESPCRRLAMAVTETLEIGARYALTLDTPGQFEGTVLWSATLSSPGFWERPLPVRAARQVTGTGTELTETERFTIHMSDIAEMIETVKSEAQLPVDQVELVLRPTLDFGIQASGRTFRLTSPGEFRVRFNSRRIAELPETLTFQDGKQLQDIRRLPVTVLAGPFEFAVSDLRAWSLAAAGALLIPLLLLLRIRRRHRGARVIRSALTVEDAHVPAGSPVILVASVDEMLRLARQTEKPILHATREDTYLLFDGLICYRLGPAPANDRRERRYRAGHEPQ